MAPACKEIAMIVRILALTAAMAGSLPAIALTVVASDCVEGSTFIENAARSRDNGMSSEAFLAQFDGDLELIKALPPAVRCGTAALGRRRGICRAARTRRPCACLPQSLPGQHRHDVGAAAGFGPRPGPIPYSFPVPSRTLVLLGSLFLK
jgi:hypothetical protein